jgi:hypothetical protein
MRALARKEMKNAIHWFLSNRSGLGTGDSRRSREEYYGLGNRKHEGVQSVWEAQQASCDLDGCFGYVRSDCKRNLKKLLSDTGDTVFDRITGNG